VDGGNTVEHTVTVVDTTGYQRMDQFLRVVDRQRTSHCPQLSKLIETLCSNSLDVLCKCQFRVKSDSKAGNTARRDDRMSLQEDGCYCVDPRQLLTHASPHDLRLVGVEFQSIRRHPAVQVFYVTCNIRYDTIR